MPTDGKFGFTVLVGGKELPEYHHPHDDSRVLIESMLWTPVTYWVEVKEYSKFSEEVEKQKWPVTPYEIKVYTEPHCVKSWFQVFVDGVKVKHMLLDSSETRIVKGFPEEGDGYSEFLFSLPRFSESPDDRVEEKREKKIGTIEVIRRSATFSHYESRPTQSKGTRFHSANKEDVRNVTKMDFTMSTTRKGRYIRDGKPYDRPPPSSEVKCTPGMTTTEIWNMGDKLRTLTVEYHMTHTLQDWGVNLVKMDWPQIDKGTIEIND